MPPHLLSIKAGWGEGRGGIEGGAFSHSGVPSPADVVLNDATIKLAPLVLANSSPGF